MVWLFEGYPERPERLRYWFLFGRPSRRMMRRHLRSGRAPDPDDIKKWAGKPPLRSRRRHTFARVATEPALTITAELTGGIVLALQIDRLTDATRPGSLAAAIIGGALVAWGVFAARSRAAYEAKLRDGVEDRLDRQIVADVVAAVETSEHNLGESLAFEIAQLRKDLEATTEELRLEMKRISEEL